MRLPVLTYPTPSLKKPSHDVKKFSSSLEELVRNMLETMVFENGIGLAAPQIGENINLFVMKVDRELDGKIIEGKTFCFINPKIVTAEGVIAYEEGCLSCPEILVSVDRAQKILVESFDPTGKPQTHVLSNLEAVCAQHEMDHLKGILLTDRISRLQRELYGKKQIRKRRDDSDRGDVE